jgi:hypothetical protein
MNLHEWKREILTERIRDLNSVPFTIKGNDYLNYGAPNAEVEDMIKDAIHCIEADELEMRAVLRACGVGTDCGSLGADMTAALNHTSLTHWRENPIAFIEQCLCDPETKKPFHLLDAERRFLEHAFKLDDDGRLLYPELLPHRGVQSDAARNLNRKWLKGEMCLLKRKKVARGACRI